MVRLEDGSSTRAFFAAGREERPKASVVEETGPLSSSEEYPAIRDMVAGADENPNEDPYVIRASLPLRRSQVIIGTCHLHATRCLCPRLRWLERFSGAQWHSWLFTTALRPETWRGDHSS